MIKSFSKGIPFVISAPSGAGKTSICKQIRAVVPNLVYSISYTTRGQRKGEINGEDYHFISSAAFQTMIAEGRFIEWAQVHGHYYGTSKDFILEKIENGIDCILDVDTLGAKRLKECFSEGVFIFIVPPTFKELKDRLIKRQTENYEQFNLRTLRAHHEMNALIEYEYIIINDILEQAVDELKSIIVAERCKTKRRGAFISGLFS